MIKNLFSSLIFEKNVSIKQLFSNKMLYLNILNIDPQKITLKAPDFLYSGVPFTLIYKKRINNLNITSKHDVKCYEKRPEYINKFTSIISRLKEISKSAKLYDEEFIFRCEEDISSQLEALIDYWSEDEDKPVLNLYIKFKEYSVIYIYMDDYISHESVAFKNYESEISSLKKKIEELQAMLDYHPDGSGYLEAKEDFESLSKKI